MIYTQVMDHPLRLAECRQRHVSSAPQNPAATSRNHTEEA